MVSKTEFHYIYHNKPKTLQEIILRCFPTALEIKETMRIDGKPVNINEWITPHEGRDDFSFTLYNSETHLASQYFPSMVEFTTIKE